ncbi:galactokinase [Paraoerskovia marina]|uniref:Galactokinase n=1 Tax=Paraoerskovia marina TaxID=545619 RepID=A0A1H1UY35_9CELL|nr:galactokinase [Paraoerskovia marina]SDS77425.1 galactokinase [Paraoerskovia marina]
MSGVLPAWTTDEGTARATTLFEQTFGAAPLGVWAAPGRVNLIGEHTDYNAGLCLPIALEHRTFVAVSPRADRLVRLVSAQEQSTVREVRLDDVAPGTVEGWPAYVVGVAWALEQAGHSVVGFDVAVDSCVPYGAGLSSSAALESAVAVALDDLAGLGLGGDDAERAALAAACVRAENEIAGAPTGGMDQSTSLRATTGNAVLLDFTPGLDAVDSARHVPFDLADAGLALLVVDTRAPHALVDGQYAARRDACERAARTLGVTSLREIADMLGRSESPADELPAVLAALDDDVRPRARHVVTEIARVGTFVGLLDAGDVTEVGPVMDASHASLRDDYEVSCPELDLAVTAAREAGALGARMTGGGFGGSAIALVRATDIAAVQDAVLAAFADAGYTPPDLLVAVPAAPAGRAA